MLIQKKDHKLEVSPDAYKSMYKRLGYEIVKEKKPLTQTKPEAKPEAKGENKNEK